MEMLDTLLGGVRSACAAFPDKRRGEVTYSMADIGMSAFSLFFMQSESFLAYQRNLAAGEQTSNCHTLFGMKAIPSDNHIRNMLDPVHPNHLQPSFDDLFSCHPLASAIREAKADFLFVCKPESHKTLYDFIDGAPLKEHKETRRLGAGRHHHCHYRWIEAVPL